MEQSFSFLQTSYGSFDLTWYNRYESDGKPDSPDFGLGKNWSAWQFARLTDHGDNISIMFSPEGYDRMSDPEGSTNAVLADFASVYYQYDAKRRVNEVSTEGGQVTETISYTTNTPSSYDPTNWVLKSVITRPDGLQKTVYANHIAQDLLTDDQDGTDHWITYRKYNADYRLAEQVHPSAIDMSGTPYNDSFDNLDCQIETGAGRIDVFTYYTTTNGTTG